MEPCHFFPAGLASMVNVQMAIEASVDNERVRHGDALRLHGMLLGVDELAEVCVVEVGHLPLALAIH